MKCPQLVPWRQGGRAIIVPTQAVIWHFWLCNCRQNGSRSLWTVHRGAPGAARPLGANTWKRRRGAQRRGGDQGIACPLHPLSELPCSRATHPPSLPTPTPRPGSGQSETAAEEQAEGDASKPRVVCPECMDAGPCSAIPCPCGERSRSIAKMLS